MEQPVTSSAVRRGGVRRVRARGLAVLAVFALAVAACGTRLPDEAFEGEGELVAGQQDGATSGNGSDTTVAGATDGDGGTTGDTTPGADGGTQQPGTEGGPTAPGAAGPNQASDVGITQTTIRIGNITAENGVLGDAFAPAVRGLRAWVQHTNAKGGIGGRKIELFTCDDREDRSRALECARRLVEQDQVFALLATNTRAFGGAAQYLHDKGVPVFGFPITNSYYRYPRMFGIYAAGSQGGYARDGNTVGYEGNIMNLSGTYRWFKEHIGVSKAAVFSYDIPESKQAAGYFQAGAELEGFEVTTYVVSFTAASFDQAVADMQRKGIEIVFDAMDDTANRRLCDAMARRQYKPKAKVSTVVSFGAGVGSKYNETCRDVLHIVGSSLPFTANTPEIAEFRQAYGKYQPGKALHQWALEAWAIGNISQQAIESMGAGPTRAGFVDFLNKMPPNDGGGIMAPISYARRDYTKPTGAECFAIARWQGDAWTAASSPFPFCVPDAKLYSSKALEQGN
jgi:branched-chain amino acid transport system substrate-binding protein